MRQFVRDRLRETSASQIAIVFSGVAFAGVIAMAMYVAATDDDETSTSAESAQRTDTDSVATPTEDGDDARSGGSPAQYLAGFGMIAVWLGSVGVSIFRAQRRQRAATGPSEPA